ncbi:helix-turn-helix domain-containing protein [Thermodesulfovibrio sp. 3462-1]|uniref:Helix-turn-helix domain-containing protein n=1 Tax=Thermodesulfovibrio obliviosus TaxID=3118332 RepID=A0AAU8H499_9BACT
MEIKLTEEELNKLAELVADKLKDKIAELINKQDEVLSFTEACSYLKCPSSWLYKAVSQGKVPHIKAGKYLKFRKSELDSWLKRRSK